MRDHDHHGSGQDGVKHADAGQTGHETGHGSLRWRMRRVLKGVVRGLAEGVLADDLHRLGEQIQCLRDSVMEDAAEVERLQTELKYVRAELAASDKLCLLMAEKRRVAYEERDEARAEVERLKAEGEDLKRTNANLHEAYEREHKEAAALRRRLAGPATMPARDTDPTGQKVVTADGRLADVCFDGLVRAEQPRPKHEATTCAGCGARLPILGPVDEEVTCECPGCGAEVTFGPVPGFSGWESMIVVAKEG